MNQHVTGVSTTRKHPMGRFASAVLFCIAGVLINLAGSYLATASGAPLFLDSLGTVLVAALGSYVPGVAVGYLTNIFNSSLDSVTLYYGVINVLIAVVVAFFARRGWLRKPLKVVALIALLALIGGGVGSVLTWFLFGGGFGEGISAPLAHQLYDTGTFSMFAAQLCADLLIDLLDKAVIVLVAVVVVNVLPRSFADLLDISLWKQRPLSAQEVASLEGRKTRHASLRAKIVALMVTVVTIVAVVTVSICFYLYHHSNIEAQTAEGAGVTNLMAESIDSSRVENYLAQGEDAPGYAETSRALATIRDSFANVRYVYVYRIREDGCHVVFDSGAIDEPGSKPGDVMPFDDAAAAYLPALLAGEPIDPIVSNGMYGWLLSVYQPVYDGGECVCYVAADISMDSVVADEYAFAAKIIALFAAFLIVLCVVALWLAEYGIVLPINAISHAFGSFAFDNEKSRTESAAHIRDLDICTGDEIENLYLAVAKTSEETVRFIAEAQERNEAISAMQNSLIAVMADMVESRDKHTGNHVKHTAAYSRLIMEELRREGYYEDILTDEFIDHMESSAPLHDIGKIQISDTILNKPGRLTDEEFEVMKSHTTVGRDIIESASEAVPESSYLDEAKNLAAYHHEKWDGSGYPHNIAGEEIPLSARIMAVADVFDALVSKRSYKEGFPVERAFAIIEEGMGTHFDPIVAQAFLNVKEEAARIAKEQSGEPAEEQSDDLAKTQLDA